MKQNEKKKRNNLELIYLDGGYYAVHDDNGQWLVMKRTQGIKWPKDYKIKVNFLCIMVMKRKYLQSLQKLIIWHRQSNPF